MVELPALATTRKLSRPTLFFSLPPPPAAGNTSASEKKPWIDRFSACSLARGTYTYISLLLYFFQVYTMKPTSIYSLRPGILQPRTGWDDPVQICRS